MTDTRDEWTIDSWCKSFPSSGAGMRASRITEAQWRLHADFTTPVAALRETALANNLARMREYCADNGVHIAPHGKTTMSPELIARQLDHGAWGITAATAWQARTMLGFGVRRILIANECIDPVGLRWIAEHMRDNPDVEVFVFADSLAAVELMREILRDVPAPDGMRPIPVLVDVGVAGGRTGARDLGTAVGVGRAVTKAPELELAGVAGFEGVIGGRRVPEIVEPVRRFLTTIRRTAEELMADGAFRADRPVVLSAGGSAFFDQVVDVFTTDRERYAQPVDVIIRSGCYITHDHGNYRESSPFRATGDADFEPAIEVWTRVVSTPEPGLAIIDAGKRDISTDSRMPVALSRLRSGERDELTGVTVERFNDQHGYLHVPGDRAGALEVGDLVQLGIAHPCTTFDKWRAMPVVDDDYRVISAVRTYF